MFERFTDRCRKTMALANQEAIHHGEAMIDTEHVLLGLVEEGTGVGAHALKLLLGDNHLYKVRLAVERLMAVNGTSTRMGKLPLSHAMNEIVRLAILESKLLNHNYVGTEHMLLGMLRQTDGIAGRALSNLGITLDQMRDAVRKTLGQEDDTSETAKEGEPTSAASGDAQSTRPKPWWRFW